MPRGVRHSLHSGVSSIQLLGDVNIETLARPPRIGRDSGCGCPGCETSVRTIDTTYPQQIEPVYTKAQWDAFLGDINRSMSSTAVPPCPLVLGLCLPPVLCFFWYCRDSRAQEREESVLSRIEEENAKLALVGLQWSEPFFTHGTCCCFKRIPTLRGSIELQMNLAVRTQYELDNPQTHQFMANILVERSQAASAVAAAQEKSRSKRNTVADPALEEIQTRLMNRQVTLVRRASMSTGKGTGDPLLVGGAAPIESLLATPSHAHATGMLATPTHGGGGGGHGGDPTSAANQSSRWATDSPKIKPSFVAVFPDEPAPVVQEMN